MKVNLKLLMKKLHTYLNKRDKKNQSRSICNFPMQIREDCKSAVTRMITGPCFCFLYFTLEKITFHILCSRHVDDDVFVMLQNFTFFSSPWEQIHSYHLTTTHLYKEQKDQRHSTLQGLR